MPQGTASTTVPGASEISRQRFRVESGHKRVRAYLDGELVVDSTRPTLVWEKPMYPTYYFPLDDVRAELRDTGQLEHSPSRGDAHVLDVAVGTATALAGARQHRESPIAQLVGLVKFEWDAMSEWLEEDEPVYTHPRDPYTRVDILASSRQVLVELDGIVVAQTDRPLILFETGLPPRYYIPLSHIRGTLLRPSLTVTHCPYKGAATYWSVDTGVRVHTDVLWTYRSPLPESQKIAGLASFYDERVDLYVDGVLQARPRTVFSR